MQGGSQAGRDSPSKSGRGRNLAAWGGYVAQTADSSVDGWGLTVCPELSGSTLAVFPAL